jgi:hypothetical protein
MSKPTYIEGEILPPLSRDVDAATVNFRGATSNADLNLIASWLDDRFEIPGTGIRFGLDAIIGWIPGIGDAIAAAASMFIIVAAWSRGAARITLFRMMLNLTIENVLGAFPVIGDFAHVAWKANRRNYNLLIRDHHSARRHTWQDWLFVIGLCLLVAAVFAAPIILLIYFFKAHPLFH